MVAKVTIALITTLLFCMSGHAQTERWDAMMTQAKALAQQKEYAKAIECNEALIAELETSGVAGMTETLRNSNAIYYIKLAVPLLEEKKYAESKEFLDNALKNAKVDGKAYYLCHTYLGLLHSTQAVKLKTGGNYHDALRLCEDAEGHYALAQKPDKRLSVQITRADILIALSRTDEAVSLYRTIIAECQKDPAMDLIRGKALCGLGDLESKQEDFQAALIHLEEAYTLCMNANEKTWALIAASRLRTLFSKGITDAEKARLWEQRWQELEDARK